jgi:hypothetical protein
VHIPATAGDFDAANIVLNQSASQQTTLSERITTIAIAVCILFFILPFSSQAQKDRHIQQWSKRLLNIAASVQAL